MKKSEASKSSLALPESLAEEDERRLEEADGTKPACKWSVSNPCPKSTIIIKLRP